MARKFDAGYYFSEGLHAVFTHGFMSFAAVCMTVACLLIMGSFSLLAVNLNNMLRSLEAQNEFLAYVDEGCSQQQMVALQQDLQQIANVANVTFVTREQALEQFLKGRESNDLLRSLPAEVLRDRFRIHVSDIQQLSATVQAVGEVTGIADTSAAMDIAQGFILVRNIATGVAVALISILLVVSLFIISNTIKLATFYRREEIAIMKMCGATNAFVQWPFVVEGMILGMLGALIAFFAQWGIYHMVGKFIVQGNGLSLFTMISYGALAKNLLLSFSVTGILIGVGGSLLAIRKFLQT